MPAICQSAQEYPTSMFTTPLNLTPAKTHWSFESQLVLAAPVSTAGCTARAPSSSRPTLMISESTLTTGTSRPTYYLSKAQPELDFRMIEAEPRKISQMTNTLQRLLLPCTPSMPNSQNSRTRPFI